MSKIQEIITPFYTSNNIRYVFIDGNANNTIDKCYQTLQQQLSFPNYFGYNLDAFEELINDLDWIIEEKIIIIIANINALLINDNEKKKDFLDILKSSDLEKLEVITLADNTKIEF